MTDAYESKVWQPTFREEFLWEPRPGTMIPPHDTHPVLWTVTAWLDNRPRLTHYLTTWCRDEALMVTLAQVRADDGLPPGEWQRYQWTVVNTHEEARTP